MCYFFDDKYNTQIPNGVYLAQMFPCSHHTKTIVYEGHVYINLLNLFVPNTTYEDI